MWRIFGFYDKITSWRCRLKPSSPAFAKDAKVNFVFFHSLGAVAEWLRRGLQNLVHRFNSGRRLQNLSDFFDTVGAQGPSGASKNLTKIEARSLLGTRRAE